MSEFDHLTFPPNITQQSYPTGALYVLATPIGNIGDITLRALHVLSLANAIACEDTRHTTHLLAEYGIHKPLLAAHEHNEHEVAQKIVTRLQKEERIVLVSDAGTPVLSDPGAHIIQVVQNAGFRIIPIPGACAAITALSASGLSSHTQFHFVGFLPAKIQQRHTLLQQLSHLHTTFIFYEAPHRILECIEALKIVFPPSHFIVIARELTKLFEEIHRCQLDEAIDWLKSNPHRQKGEFVVLLENIAPNQETTSAETHRILSILMSECSVKQAATLTAKITGEKKNTLYELALQLKET